MSRAVNGRRRMIEPPHGSVVMAHGLTGTAWQRFFDSGKWHSTTGLVKTWDELQESTLTLSSAGVQYPRLTVIYRAEEEVA